MNFSTQPTRIGYFFLGPRLEFFETGRIQDIDSIFDESDSFSTWYTSRLKQQILRVNACESPGRHFFAVHGVGRPTWFHHHMQLKLTHCVYCLFNRRYVNVVGSDSTTSFERFAHRRGNRTRVRCWFTVGPQKLKIMCRWQFDNRLIQAFAHELISDKWSESQLACIGTVGYFGVGHGDNHVVQAPAVANHSGTLIYGHGRRSYEQPEGSADSHAAGLYRGSSSSTSAEWSLRSIPGRRTA